MSRRWTIDRCGQVRQRTRAAYERSARSATSGAAEPRIACKKIRVNFFLYSVSMSWQLLSTHGRVLVAVARDRGSRLRDIAETCGITERTAHRVVAELVEQGYLTKERTGSRNHYEIRPEVPIHDPLLGEHWVGEILAVLVGGVQRARVSTESEEVETQPPSST